MRDEVQYGVQTLTRPKQLVKLNPVEARTNSQSESKWIRGLLLLAEVLLILTIIGLLVAIWMPVWIGAHPGVGPH